MKTKLNLVAAGLFLAALGTGLGQPVITQQPQSCTNVVRTTATFTVEATGTQPLAYQWQKSTGTWADLADCTNAAMVLTNVQTTAAGDYRVIVTNVDGAITSDMAHLTVLLPPTLRFSTSSYTVAEWAGSTVSLTVWRLNDTRTPVTVDFATADGSAKAGLDYTATNGTLVFGAGVTNQTLVVSILNDGLAEATESFRVALSNPTNAVLGSPAVAGVSITDSDIGVQFQFADYSVAEDAGVVLVSVVREDDGTVPVTVDFATTDLTATNGVDYTGITNTLSFASQERLKLVPVPILNDSLKEALNKTFRVTLSNPVGATLASQNSAIVTIVDNDQGSHCFETNMYSVMEDAGVALITVLGGTDDTNSTYTVDLTTADSSARSGQDYLGLTNTLVFASGERRKLVPVPILNNGIRQGTRGFRVTLSNPAGGAVLGSPTTTTVYIQDNDPGVGFEFTSYTNPRGQFGDFAVTVVRGTDWALGPIAVDYATGGGTATPIVDYQPVSGTLKFEQNETLKSISIPILRASTGKNFQVTLSNPTGGAALGASTTTVNLGGTYVTVMPPYDSGLAIRQAYGVNVLTWSGGGTLQRADRPTGPWQTLANATSPYTVQSPIPTSFYRVAGHRPVSVYVPSGYDSRTNLPLVLLLHGYNSHTDAGARQEAYMQFQPLAEERGFLYCYPDGNVDRWGYRFWNGTDACDDFGNTGIDDAGYLRAVIEEIERRFAVDRKRVHLIGHSNGANMTYGVACRSADLVAGLAGLAGNTFLDPSRCQPSEPVNILCICGTADQYDNYYGGADRIKSNLPPFPGVLQNIQIWAGYNGARDPVTDAARSMDLDLFVPGLDTVVTRYTSYPPGGAVELWSIVGGTHIPTLHDGSSSSEFAPRVIDWLLAHPKP